MSTLINASSFKNLVTNWSNESGENAWQKEYNEYVNPLTSVYNESMRDYDIATRDAGYAYEKAVGQAYDAYVANKRASAFANYGTGDISSMEASYSKAYEEARKQYRENYESAIENIEAKRAETTANYAETVTEFANAVNEQQESIAQGYADFFNSYYDYLNSVYKQYGTNEYLFGSSSPLSQFVSGNELMSRENVYKKFMHTDATGKTTLTEDALKYLQAVGGLSEYALSIDPENLGGIQTFQDYLHANAPKVEEFRTKYGDKFYEDIGFENKFTAYDTSVYGKYAPDGTYGTKKQSGGDIDYKIKWRSGKNVDITVDDVEWDLVREKDIVSDAISRALNSQTTGKVDKAPADETIQIYGGKVYVYDGTNQIGWHQLEGDENTIEEFVAYWVSRLNNDDKLKTQINYQRTKDKTPQFSLGSK